MFPLLSHLYYLLLAELYIEIEKRKVFFYFFFWNSSIVFFLSFTPISYFPTVFEPFFIIIFENFLQEFGQLSESISCLRDQIRASRNLPDQQAELEIKKINTKFQIFAFLSKSFNFIQKN